MPSYEHKCTLLSHQIDESSQICNLYNVGMIYVIFTTSVTDAFALDLCFVNVVLEPNIQSSS